MNKSVIFDIDGTLLYARGSGRQAFGTAFRAAYGVEYCNVDKICFVGATDSNVVRNMAIESGITNTPALEEHFFMVLARELDRALATQKPLVYAGVPEFLAALTQCSLALGIITGNIRSTAWSKLRHGGIDRFFCFGAYGDDHHERSEIARRAIRRAPSAAPVAVMIGDTPLDIQAAKTHNLIAVAVATGWVSAADLAEAGADLVLDDFSDTARCVAGVMNLLR